MKQNDINLSAELAHRLETLQFPAVWDPKNVYHLSLNETSGFGVTVHLIIQVTRMYVCSACVLRICVYACICINMYQNG